MVDEPRPYQLYWHKTTSSLAPMAVLEEAGAAYEAVEIDVIAGEHKGAAFREIHPLGLMPALRLPDGRTVFESAGIAMFVADRHPEAGIAPDPASADRAFYNQWLFYLADTLFPTYGRYYRPARLSTDAGDNEPIKARPPSIIYRARKALRKYRSQSIIVGVLLTAIVSMAVWLPGHDRRVIDWSREKDFRRTKEQLQVAVKKELLAVEADGLTQADRQRWRLVHALRLEGRAKLAFAALRRLATFGHGCCKDMSACSYEIEGGGAQTSVERRAVNRRGSIRNTPAKLPGGGLTMGSDGPVRDGDRPYK